MVTVCTARCLLYVPPVVTVCTASLTFNSSTFCPHSVFVCFVWIWEQTAFISLYSINWLVFITEAECVYCAVRTGSLTQTDTFWYLKGLNNLFTLLPSLRHGSSSKTLLKFRSSAVFLPKLIFSNDFKLYVCLSIVGLKSTQPLVDTSTMNIRLT